MECQGKIDCVDIHNSLLKLELDSISKTCEWYLGTHAAEVANKQHLESIYHDGGEA